MNPGLLKKHFDVGDLIALLKTGAADAQLWSVAKAAKGTELFGQGQECPHVFILLSGLVKLSYMTPNGAEWVKSFVIDCGVFSASETVGPGGNSRYSATCLEDCRLARLPADWVQAQIDRDASLQAAFTAFSSWVRRRKEMREEELLCLNAEDRYRRFLNTQPVLASRLKQADIARFLGVTPVAFSRIRKRVLRAKKPSREV